MRSISIEERKLKYEIDKEDEWHTSKKCDLNVALFSPKGILFGYESLTIPLSHHPPYPMSFRHQSFYLFIPDNTSQADCPPYPTWRNESIHKVFFPSPL